MQVGETIRVDDEEKRENLLVEEPGVALDVHEPATADMHEYIPEVAALPFLGEQVSAHQESQDESYFQPLIQGIESPEIVEAVGEPEGNADHGQTIQPDGGGLFDSAQGGDETQRHSRDAAGFHACRDPVVMVDEEYDPGR